MQRWLWLVFLLPLTAWASSERSYFFEEKSEFEPEIDQDANSIQLPLADGNRKEGQHSKQLQLNRSLDAAEVFRRTQWLLNEAHSPLSEPPASVAHLNGRQTLNGFSQTIRILDPSGDFANHLSTVSESSDPSHPESRLTVFQDVVSKRVQDFSIHFAYDHPEPVADQEYFHNRLLNASRNWTDSRPLAGLKIALDPGHMGGNFWDGRTGKYVRDPHGRKLSEGLLALQTALLLEQEFQRLGATVFLTRRDLAPVTPIRFEDFHPADYGSTKLRESIYYGWFQSALDDSPPGPDLMRALNRSGYYRSLFSGGRRDQYYILDVDLNARSEAIRRFNPDIAMIIHFDTGDVRGDSTAVNYGGGHFSSTKVYVVGAASMDELATREDRGYFAHQLMDSYLWNASLKLGRSVVHSMSTGLRIPFSRSGGGRSQRVEPGIYARNLEVSRKVPSAAVSYLECLHYNDANEFAQLTQYRHSMSIGGNAYGYSDRLISVADSIKQGVLKFVREYAGN